MLDFTVTEGKVRIAVLSGKGGTGKTLVSVNLASVAQSMYIDCDVEEPNGHLFFCPQDTTVQDVSVNIPQFDSSKCVGCKQCVNFCEFNALAYVKDKPIVFGEVCHSCGGCMLLCPSKAITEKPKVIGKVITGTSQQVTVLTGMLNTGESSGIPIIRQLLGHSIISDDDYTIIDCPPGSACTVMESIKDVDYCILVAEPTVFGAHNLNMVYELVKLFNKPFGVVLNKCVSAHNPSEQFCIDHNIKVLQHIDYDKELGQLNSNGVIAVRHSQKYSQLFSALLDQVLMEVQHEATIST